MSALTYWLWLSELQGLTNQTQLALLRRFETPERIFYADPEELLLTEGITRQQAELLSDHRLDGARKIQEDCHRLNIRILTIGDAEYPGRLKNIYDPPMLLYMKGRMPVMDEEVAIAVVGTRNCTPYGEGCAKKLGHELSAAGAVVVSGLAKGIDAAATHGALMAGGVTVGVVGNGLDVRYPYESRFLYDDVAAAGVLISEYPPGAEAAGWHFPARNRILSGLCVGTLVVEAPLRSGALITAETALEQGRDVFAVPGPIDAENSAGCNRLIQEGALLVTGAEDILREYEGRYPQKLRPRTYTEPPKTAGYQARQLAEAKPVPPSVSLSRELPELSDDQLAILRLLGEEPMQVDDIIELTDIPTRRVLSALTVLEMDELVTQHSGKRYTRAVTLTE
jgi:DNA processing protein